MKNNRCEEILDILKHEGYISVSELSKRLYSSQPTIRRDLAVLEQNGSIQRCHGGATIVDKKIDLPVQFRKNTYSKEKIRICRLASELISPNSLLFIDASSTASYLAGFLKKSQNITVVTNGLPICYHLSLNNVTAISTGGHFVKSSEAFIGRCAEQTASCFNADLMFFSSSSMDHDGIISDYSERETALRLCMMKNASKTVFLIDSAKIGKKSAYRVCSLADIDYLATNTILPDELLDKYGLKMIKRINGVYLYNSTQRYYQ